MSINLKRNSGLDIEFDLDSFKLGFGKDMLEVEAVVRTFDQMQDVLLDKKISGPKELYYMYRGVGKSSDKEKIRQNNLRYDIAVVKAGFLGAEFVKTFGHSHLNSYSELYEVLWGEALCLMQKPNTEDSYEIEDVIVVFARAKEKIIVLPNYGHILINPSNETPLVTANWVFCESKSDYSMYREAKGAAYFVTNDDGEVKFIKNNFFRNIPKIRKMRLALPNKEFGLSLEEPIYNLINKQDKLDFLKYPGKCDYSSCFIKDKSLFAAVPL